MTWRDGAAAWRDFDTQHRRPWWAGVAVTAAGAAFAVLVHMGKLAASPRAMHALLAVLALLTLFLGRRLFWNDGERRLRALFRIVLMNALFYLLFQGGRAAGLPLSRDAMFNGGSRAMALGSVTVGVLFGIAAILAVRLFDRRPVAELGIVPEPGFWSDLAFGLFLGAFLMSVIFGIELAAGWIHVTQWRSVKAPDVSFARALGNMAAVFLAVGFYEELSSRGYLLRALAQGFVGRWIPATWAIALATLVSSAAFGAGHIGNPNATWVSTTNIVLAGFVLALPFIMTGRLTGSIGLHITWNFFQGCVFGFPVSGLVTPVSLIAIEQGGPAAWTGGAFGPEAGIVGLLAMALGTVLFIGRERLRRGSASLATSIAEGRGPRLFTTAA